MKKLFILGFAVFTFGLALSVNANAQRVDTDFGVKTRKDGVVFGYSVWITTDGVLHCTATTKLKADAELTFKRPETSTTAPDGSSTGSGGGISRKATLKAPLRKPLEYTTSISGDSYTSMHSITVVIASESGSSATIILINKKVPAKIAK